MLKIHAYIEAASELGYATATVYKGKVCLGHTMGEWVSSNKKLINCVTTSTLTLFPISLYFVFVDMPAGHLKAGCVSLEVCGGSKPKRRSSSVGEK